MKLPSEYFKEINCAKVDGYHRFGDLYDMIVCTLLNLRNLHPIKVLEIGVSRFDPPSPVAFCNMPFVSQYIGVDIDPLRSELPPKGMFCQGDGYNQQTIDRFAKYAPFHLIIDDGSHNPIHQKWFFENYIHLLNKPGFIVCEDVHEPNIEKITDADMQRIWADPYNEATNILFKFQR